MSCIHLFLEGLSGESVKPTREVQMAVWVVIRILHIGVDEIYKLFVFQQGLIRCQNL